MYYIPVEEKMPTISVYLTNEMYDFIRPDTSKRIQALIKKEMERKKEIEETSQNSM